MRPRGDADSSPVTRNVGQCGRQSPHCTHAASSSSSSARFTAAPCARARAVRSGRTRVFMRCVNSATHGIDRDAAAARRRGARRRRRPPRETARDRRTATPRAATVAATNGVAAPAATAAEPSASSNPASCRCASTSAGWPSRSTHVVVPSHRMHAGRCNRCTSANGSVSPSEPSLTTRAPDGCAARPRR